MSTRLDEWRADFRRQFELARAGDQAATEHFVKRYGKYFLRIIRSQLHSRLHTIIDSIDVLEDFWASLFASPHASKIHPNPDRLVAYLQMAARNTARQVNRKHLRVAKRDLNRETHLDTNAMERLPARRVLPECSDEELPGHRKPK